MTSGSPLRFSRPTSRFAKRDRLAIASILSFVSNSLRLRSNFFREDINHSFSSRVNCLNRHEWRVLNMSLSPVRAGLQVKIDKAVQIIGQFNGAVVALSAGVDSSLVAALASKALGDRVVAIAGFSKRDVRETAHLLGLEVWDKPAMPCLSSRISHGEEITVEKLSQVGKAESVVKRISGARDIRVRHHGEVAAIEVSQEELPLFHRDGLMKQVEKDLGLIGFTRVTLGPRKTTRRQATAVVGQDYLLPIINMSNHRYER